MIAYTHTATGSVETAEDDRFRWFYGADGYVHDKIEGRDIYLPVGGYSKVEGWGSDPAPADVVVAARAFSAAIDAENIRIAESKANADRAQMDEAVTVVTAIPAAAVAELAAINAGYASLASGTNEGCEGYVPQISWAGKTGKEILARHGMTQDQINQIVAAVQVLAA